MSRAASNKKFLANNPTLRAPHMEHIRNVKAEMFYHEGLAECSVNARYAWIGLWTQSDKFGRFPWKPKFLKSRIMPFDNVDFESLMLELARGGFIERYAVDGQDYGFSPNWSKHQGIGTREKQSAFSYPAPTSVLHCASKAQAPSAHSADTVPAQEPHRAMSVEVEVGVDVGMGKEIGVESESGNQNTAPRSRASADTARSRPSKPSLDDSTDSKPNPPVVTVEDVIQLAKTTSEGRACVTKTAKADLGSALASLKPPAQSREIAKAIRAKLKTCEDAYSFANFGTALAADLVATVQFNRKKEADDWQLEMITHVRGDEDYGAAWLASEPPPVGWDPDHRMLPEYFIDEEREKRDGIQKAKLKTVAASQPVQEVKPEVVDDNSADVIVEEGEMCPAEWMEYFRRRLRGDFSVLKEWLKENECPAECRAEFIRLFEEEQQRRKK
jgi:hypothetical protein